MKNPSSFYNEAYIKGRMSAMDNTLRWEDNGNFYEAAITGARLADMIGRPPIADIGCGRGFVVRHLRNLQYKTDGFEYGEAALKHSVCDAKFCDLTDRLPIADGAYGLVMCTGVITHIGEEHIPHALSELRRITRPHGFLFANLITEYAELQRHHKTFKPKGWWMPFFEGARWRYATEYDDFLKSRGSNKSGSVWAAVFEAI